MNTFNLEATSLSLTEKLKKGLGEKIGQVQEDLKVMDMLKRRKDETVYLKGLSKGDSVMSSDESDKVAFNFGKSV